MISRLSRGAALGAVAFFLAVALPRAASPPAAPGEMLDDFQTADGWVANNPNAPGKVSSDGDILTITDLPGGKVNWGTSAYRTFEVNIDKTPWVVVKFTGGNAPFGMTLVNQATKDKRSGAMRLFEPGIGIVNMAEAFDWKGSARVSVGLYAYRSEGTVHVDWLRFASALRAEEKANLEAAKPRIKAKPLHGLDALAARKGWRRLEDFRRGDAYLSERTVFTDTATSHTIWRMTSDPGMDYHTYYDIPVWNADGSLMMFMTGRRGTLERWLMNADGSHLRPFPGDDGPALRDAYWHGTDPDLVLYADYDRKGSHILKSRVKTLDVVTGESKTLLELDGKVGRMMPPHPSGESFLFGATDRDVDAPSTATVVKLGGAIQTILFERRWHRLRFTNAADRRIFFNFDEPRTQWSILPDGSDRHEIPDAGSHPNYMSDGSEMTYFASGGVWAVRLDGTGKRLLYNLGGGGHGGPTLDRDWFIADTYHGGPAPTALFYFTTDGKQKGGPVFVTQSSILPHTARWHPYSHSTHPHPITSPDGTKAVCGSDMLGDFTDVYVVVLRKPDPPRNWRSERHGDVVYLNWDPPKRAREIKGYRVYSRYEESFYTKRHKKVPPPEKRWGTHREYPITETSGSVLAETDAILITAVEHSGLESEPVCVWTGSANSDSVAGPPVFDPYYLLAAADCSSPGTVRLTWEGIRFIAYYNVYRSDKPDFTPSPTLLVGSPSEPEFVDWALPHGKTFWYRVVSVNTWGNEAKPSQPVAARTMDFDPVAIELRAADAKLEKMTAKGGLAPTGEPRKGRAEWTVDVPREGDYAFWGRSVSTPKTRPVVNVMLDGKYLFGWRVTGHWDRAAWSAVSSQMTGAPTLVHLTKGRHTFALQPRDKAARILELRITDDPTFWPVKEMNRRQ